MVILTLLSKEFQEVLSYELASQQFAFTALPQEWLEDNR